MNKYGTNRFYIGAGIILLAAFLMFMNSVLQEFKDDGYVNAIELSQVKGISLNGSIDKEWLLTDQGKLFCVSLASKEIIIIDVNDGSIVKVIDLGKRFKEVKVVNDNQYVYFVLGYQNIARVNIVTNEYKMIESNKDNKLENNFVYLHGDKLVTSDILMELKIFNLTSGKIDSSVEVASFNRIKIYNDMIYCYGSGDSIYAYDINNLELVWEYVETTQHESPGVAFYNNKVVFNNVYDTYVFNAKTGETIIEYPLHTQDIEIMDNRMYTVLWNKSISRVDPNNGKIVWTVDDKQNGIKAVSKYVIVNDRGDTKLKKYLAEDGSLIWSSPFIDDYLSELAVYQDYYVIRTRDGAIHLVDSLTGQELWRYKTKPFNNDRSNYRIFKDQLIITDGGKQIKICKLSFN